MNKEDKINEGQIQLDVEEKHKAVSSAMHAFCFSAGNYSDYLEWILKVWFGDVEIIENVC